MASGLRLHFVWMGRRFPYHCRLAVESSLDAMPSAQAVVHLIGEPPEDPNLDAIAGRRDVEVVLEELPALFAGCPGGSAPYLALLDRLPGHSPAAISNLARLAVLHRDGGVYLDTDVLVLAPLDDPDQVGAYIGVERVWAGNRSRVSTGLGLSGALRATPWAASWVSNRLRCRLSAGRFVRDTYARPPSWSRLQANNAVIGAPARSPFIARTLEAALRVDASARFALGPSLLDDMCRDAGHLITVLPPSRFYAIPPGQSYRAFEDVHIELPEDAQVLHYVASNHKRLLAELDEDDMRFETRQAPFWRRGRDVRRWAPRHDTVAGSS